MTVALNGIAHIQLTVNDAERCIPFWERLCHFLAMKTLIKGPGIVYCIGSRTGILVRQAPPEKRGDPFDQDRAGLHHLCFRARCREDVDAVYRFLVEELRAHIVHAPEDGPQFAPGYYSVLFEDPDGIRVEVNHVPGKGHLGPGGRLGPGGEGPARSLAGSSQRDAGAGSLRPTAPARRARHRLPIVSRMPAKVALTEQDGRLADRASQDGPWEQEGGNADARVLGRASGRLLGPEEETSRAPSFGSATARVWRGPG